MKYLYIINPVCSTNPKQDFSISENVNTAFNRLLKVMRFLTENDMKGNVSLLERLTRRGIPIKNFRHFHCIFKNLIVCLGRWGFVSQNVSECLEHAWYPVWQQQSLHSIYLWCIGASPCCLCQQCFWLYITGRTGRFSFRRTFKGFWTQADSTEKQPSLPIQCLLQNKINVNWIQIFGNKKEAEGSGCVKLNINVAN